MGTQPVEMAESLSLAFLHLLESLSPSERIAFLLREVFDAGYKEVAAALETSEANSRSRPASRILAAMSLSNCAICSSRKRM
jgi:DNA-directed RNA polymerase specialized sigma24 family protein